MDALDAIHTRRSVRQFTADEVTEQQAERLMRAAMAAPSAANQQPWRFVLVRDAETRAKLAEATPYAAPVGRAPLVIVVLADTSVEKFPGNWPLDCAAAVENLLLAAHASGLGAVWLGVHPDSQREAAVGALVSAPKGFRVFCMIAVGTPQSDGPVVDRYRAGFVKDESWA